MEILISTRIKELMGYLGFTAAAFADGIGLQRSVLSHILSERNKPSLDVIQKIIAKHPEVNIYWLLSGKGQMIDSIKTVESNDNDIITTSAELFPEPKITNVINENKPNLVESGNRKLPDEDNSPILSQPDLTKKRKIEMITIFYSDKTFEVFQNDKEF